jgi:hypothetical protein
VAQLQAGASFAVLAKKHSKHVSSETGGELPPIPAEAKIPVLEGRETMQPGELLGRRRSRWRASRCGGSCA